MSSLNYRPEIDGLRAVSVVGVLLFHAHLGFTGGFVGVDVFFVISGFLITSLILKELDERRFTLRNFWERRVRRIVPALLPMMVAVAFAGYWLLLPADLVALGKSLIAQSVMAANLYFWRDTTYAAGPAELKPLLHTWSLAIEEQFYFIFPLALIYLHRFGRRVLMEILVAALAISFAGNVYGVQGHPSATFYLLPTRAWELLAGSVIAASPGRLIRSRVVNEALGWTGIICIFIAMLSYDRSTIFPGAAAALPVAGAVLVIVANSSQQTFVGRLLSLKPVVYVGMISYSLYLWHWPLLAYGRYFSDGRLSSAGAAGLCGLSGLLAVISYHVCEQPIRKNRVYWTRKKLAAGALIGLVSMIGTGGWLWSSDGCKWRVPVALRSPVPASILSSGQSAMLKVTTSSAAEKDTNGIAPSFVVWGDSHAGAAVPLFQKIASECGITGLDATQGGCPPLPGARVAMSPNLPDWNAHVLKEIERRKIRLVFLISRWASYVEGASDYDIWGGAQLNESLIYDDTATASRRTPQSAMALFERKMSELCERLVAIGCRVYIVPQVPDQEGNPPRRAFVAARTFDLSAFPQKGTSRAQYRARQARVLECLNHFKSDRVEVLGFDEVLFDDEGDSRLSWNGQLIYQDNQHLSNFGAEQLLGRELRRILCGWKNAAVARERQSHQATRSE